MHRLTPLLALALAGLPAASQTASFQGLGDLPGGNFSSFAHDVSADGAVVVGRSESAIVFGDPIQEAFRWTADSGMVGLGRLPGSPVDRWSEAFAASADGAVVVGVSPSATGWMAFRWTTDAGMIALGQVPNANGSAALSVSADGAVVVGASGSDAFRWTADGGMAGYRAGGGSYSFWGVSADGSVAASSACSGIPTCWSYRWSVGGGWEALGQLPGGSDYTRAYDVSADGGVVVGYSTSEAYRWTAGGGMVGLGGLSDFNRSEAYGVSGNGGVVVGSSASAGESEAFRWTIEGGMQGVTSLLTAAGVNVSGWELFAAYGVSDDGTVIVGTGVNPQGQWEAWRAVLPILVAVDPSPGAALTLAAWPNPVGTRATLRFRLPAAGRVRLSLVDALGRPVAVVVDGERGAGEHAATVDASRLPAGVYVARLEAGGDSRTQRVTIVR